MTAAASELPIYLGHSYRSDDRQVNLFFLEILLKEGLITYVDPQGDTFTDTRLEWLMRACSGFIAIVTLRPGQATYLCSPFMIYEYSIAVEANLPRLIFVESQVPGHIFPESERFVFHRDSLTNRRSSIAARIHEFASRLHRMRDPREHLRGNAVVALRAERSPYSGLVEPIMELIHSNGFRPILPDPDRYSSLEFSLLVTNSDFAVVDTGGHSQPIWVWPKMLGTLPLLKIRRAEPLEGGAPTIYECFCGRDLIPYLPKEDGPIELWDDSVWLLRRMELKMIKIGNPPTALDTQSAVNKYFWSAGRRSLKVFISATDATDTLARELRDRFSAMNISFFHYVYRNSLAQGGRWQELVLPEVDGSGLFLALVDQHYMDREWCRREYARALEKGVTVIPYMIDRHGTFPQQSTPVHFLSVKDQADLIATEVDQILVSPS